MKLFKWESGRQEATKNIKKLTLWFKWNLDCYLIYVPKDTRVDWHFDKVEGKAHTRLNITLFGLWKFWTKREVSEWSKEVIKYFFPDPPFVSFEPYEMYDWQFFSKINKFRPDIQEHAADFQKNTLILSIGWAKNA